MSSLPQQPGPGYTALLAGGVPVVAGLAVVRAGLDGHHMGPVQIDGGPVHAFAASDATTDGQPFRVHETGWLWLLAAPGEVLAAGDPIAAVAGGHLRRARPDDIPCGRALTGTTGAAEPEIFTARVSVEPSLIVEHAQT